MLTHEQLLFIGQISSQCRIPVKTIRYYEDLDLIQSSGRTEGGFRQFSSDVFPRLAFIKRAQSLGLSLQEIAEILKVYDQGQLPCGEIKKRLEDKLLEIDRRVKQLQILQTELKGLLSGWESFPVEQNGTICPIIQSSGSKAT